MTYYTDNRFDTRQATSYHYSAPIGPHGRVSHLSINTKALPGYPGWHLLNMYGDYAYSVECSTRDVLGAIALLQAEWIAEVAERWHRSY
ncbi:MULTISPECIES: hypothetical protein [unclassified Bradyrhizobium]|uniref:hypothetical protein n=1 Tax=unclassified Bradyrhizobium TaxID=2631580 RepID=UPI0029166CA6|nr:MULTISPECIES: hypothetical protein [unclassified Bradyrhizobium]